MWTPSRGSNAARRSGHRRIADYLADDQTTNTDTSDNESYTTAYGDEFFAAAAAAAGSGGGGMLPAFLADQGDLVEVMLELDEESMVVPDACTFFKWYDSYQRMVEGMELDFNEEVATPVAIAAAGEADKVDEGKMDKLTKWMQLLVLINIGQGILVLMGVFVLLMK
ncbi:hypothetical protein OsI_31508 [Oryza sativa Indica Group]|uniref:Uncharacterized protein n=1 Tax=Oryza sativa subsp. indica TaxID=39946 RepID=A2Z1M3_ORYSI|nr:hypothetical protein OsI_31508 [Oryza sativa Indica Group]